MTILVHNIAPERMVFVNMIWLTSESPELEPTAREAKQWKRICKEVCSSLEKLEKGLEDMIIEFQILRSSSSTYAVTVRFQDPKSGVVEEALSHVRAIDILNIDQVVNSLLRNDGGMTLADILMEHREKGEALT